MDKQPSPPITHPVPPTEQKINTNTNKLLTVTVKNPERTEFEGMAAAISSSNERGTFDILPFHANFISIIKEVLIIHQPDGKELKIPLQHGVIKAHEDVVHVLIGIETSEKEPTKATPETTEQPK